jgi:excisionase family DNA binding protein
MFAKELLSADEAASTLNVTRRTILRWARDRRIESVRVSRKIILFPDSALENFVNDKTLGVESAMMNRPRSDIRTGGPQVKKGGDNRSSGESWQDLKKEVLSWD